MRTIEVGTTILFVSVLAAGSGCNKVTDCKLRGVRRVNIDYSVPSKAPETALGKLGPLFGFGEGALRADDNPNGNFILVEFEMNRDWMDEQGLLQGLSALVSNKRVELDIDYPTKPPTSTEYNGKQMSVDQFRQERNVVEVTGMVYGVKSSQWTIELSQKFEGEPEQEIVDVSNLPAMPHYCDGLEVTVWGIRRQDRTVEARFTQMTVPLARLLEPANEDTYAGQGGPGTSFWNAKEVIKRQQGIHDTEKFAAIYFAPPGQTKATLTVGNMKIALTK